MSTCKSLRARWHWTHEHRGESHEFGPQNCDTKMWGLTIRFFHNVFLQNGSKWENVQKFSKVLMEGSAVDLQTRFYNRSARSFATVPSGHRSYCVRSLRIQTAKFKATQFNRFCRALHPVPQSTSLLKINQKGVLTKLCCLAGSKVLDES